MSELEARVFAQDQLLAAQTGDTGALMRPGLEHVTPLQPFSGRGEPPQSPQGMKLVRDPFKLPNPTE